MFLFCQCFHEGCFGHCAVELTIPVLIVREGVSTCGMCVIAKQVRQGTDMYRNRAIMRH